MKNLILIGIMGCGKSTIGRMVAKRFKMTFLDMDHEIEKRHGPIPALFEIGEDHFRDLESALAQEISGMQNVVVSTGGGVIKRPENIRLLRSSGVIVFLDRPLATILKDIDTSHRPLLKDGPEKLVSLFEERYPIYRRSCDFRVDASDGFHHTISQIRAIWKRETGGKTTPREHRKATS